MLWWKRSRRVMPRLDALLDGGDRRSKIGKPSSFPDSPRGLRTARSMIVFTLGVHQSEIAKEAARTPTAIDTKRLAGDVSARRRREE